MRKKKGKRRKKTLSWLEPFIVTGSTIGKKKKKLAGSNHIHNFLHNRTWFTLKTSEAEHSRS